MYTELQGLLYGGGVYRIDGAAVFGGCIPTIVTALSDTLDNPTKLSHVSNRCAQNCKDFCTAVACAALLVSRIAGS